MSALRGARLLEAKSRGFACPQERLDERFLTDIVTGHSAAIVRLFVDRHGRYIRSRRGSGLLELLTRWGASETSWANAWDTSFGDALRALRRGLQNDVTQAAASLALHLSSAGVQGRWRLTLEHPSRLRWGRWLLPEADEIEVKSDGASATVESRRDGSSHRAIFTYSGDEWECIDAEPLHQFGQPGGWITLMPRYAFPSNLQAAPLNESVSRIQNEMVKLFQAAMALMEKHAPVYVRWVQRVLRHILVLQYHKTRMRSGNSEDESGLVHISFCKAPMPLAEMMVHEASHQYFNILTRIGPVDDTGDRELHYSPLVKKMRPIRFILLGYHAFANVLLLYHLCESSGVDDGGYCERQRKRLIPELETLAGPLRKNPALTALGRGLCEPLFARIDSF